MQKMLTVDNAKLNVIGVNNNDMLNMKTTVLNADEQDLTNAFFASLPNARPHAPKLTQKQLMNQMIHNANNMRMR